ncbi:MAG: YveK family protein [Erysipelotrichaceae bacterium]
MHYEDNDTIDLLKLFEIVMKNIVWFIIVIILCGTVAYAGTTLLIDKTYSATATVIIVQNNNSNASQAVTYNDVQLSQKLVSTYTQILQSEAIGDSVVANLDLYDKYEIDTEKLNKMVEVKAASNTEVMNITATTKDPKLSADIANEMVSVFKKKIFDIMSVENVTVLNSAKIPTKPSGPSILKNTAIGMMIGAVLCGIYAVIVLLTDTKVKTEEDVKKIFDYPVIGVIPEFKVEERGKNND